MKNNTYLKLTLSATEKAKLEKLANENSMLLTTFIHHLLVYAMNNPSDLKKVSAKNYADVKNMQQLAQKIKAIRKAKNLTLRQIAKKADKKISPSYISLIEKQQLHVLSPKILKALAKGLDIDVSEL